MTNASRLRPHRIYRNGGKRAFDFALVILASPLWIPIAIGVGLCVRFKLGRPILFTQTRPGRHGRPFAMIKFRSMTNARAADGQLLPDADRLAPFGRWLRSTSLDELPELLNVARGEMSLVGPRPLLMEYLPLYSKQQTRRHEVRPGVTGLAQVSGRNALSWDEKFALDVRYVDCHSLWLDITILARTLLNVVRRHGISAVGEATMPKFSGGQLTTNDGTGFPQHP